jgi:branched-chain amino acid transport system ATP-binding protein
MGLVEGAGSVQFKGQEILGHQAFEIAHRGIGYVPENRDIFPKLTVHQNLMLGEKRGKTKPRWSFDDMYRMFPRLKERQHTEAGVLSGGEQQMLTLCRTLMGDPDLIMIDEPTEGPGAEDRRTGGRVPEGAEEPRRVGAAGRAEADHRAADLRAAAT